MPIGIGKTTAGRAGNVPQVNITGYTRTVEKRLFYSRREQALLLEKAVKGGFGALEMGQVMTQVYKDGTDYADFIVPYGDNGQVALTANAASGQKNITVAAEDVVKFAEGDAVTINDDDTSAENGVIDSISGNVITLEANLTGSFATAQNAYITHRQDGNYYVMDQDVDTGEERQAQGALTSVVIGNAVLYQDAVIGMDNTALSDLDGKEDGVFYVIK